MKFKSGDYSMFFNKVDFLKGVLQLKAKQGVSLNDLKAKSEEL